VTCPGSSAPGSACAPGHLPGDRDPKAVWLWWPGTGALPADADRCWQACLRHFDLEHTVRLVRQVLGWTAPKIRDPAAAGRRTRMIITAHTRPVPSGRPARPSERPIPPGRLTPLASATSARRPPSLGCPPGSRNRRSAPRHEVGKTTKRDLTLKARREHASSTRSLQMVHNRR
jgi:hypothetical protein